MVHIFSSLDRVRSVLLTPRCKRGPLASENSEWAREELLGAMKGLLTTPDILRQDLFKEHLHFQDKLSLKGPF